MRHLFGYTINILGDICLPKVTNALADHFAYDGDWCSAKVRLSFCCSKWHCILFVTYFVTHFDFVLSISFLVQVGQVMLRPHDIDREVLLYRKEKQKNSDLLVTWSRSTSASSIYRYVRYPFFFLEKIELSMWEKWIIQLKFPRIIFKFWNLTILQFQNGGTCSEATEHFNHWMNGIPTHLVHYQILY